MAPLAPHVRPWATPSHASHQCPPKGAFWGAPVAYDDRVPEILPRSFPPCLPSTNSNHGRPNRSNHRLHSPWHNISRLMHCLWVKWALLIFRSILLNCFSVCAVSYINYLGTPNLSKVRSRLAWDSALRAWFSASRALSLARLTLLSAERNMFPTSSSCFRDNSRSESCWSSRS